jgi:hypothetical protein
MPGYHAIKGVNKYPFRGEKNREGRRGQDMVEYVLDGL